MDNMNQNQTQDDSHEPRSRNVVIISAFALGIGFLITSIFLSIDPIYNDIFYILSSISILTSFAMTISREIKKELRHMIKNMINKEINHNVKDIVEKEIKPSVNEAVSQAMNNTLKDTITETIKKEVNEEVQKQLYSFFCSDNIKPYPIPKICEEYRERNK